MSFYEPSVQFSLHSSSDWGILNLFYYLSKFAVTTNPTNWDLVFMRKAQERVYFISWIIVRTFNEWNLCLNLYEWERSIDVRSFNVPHKWLTDLYQWLIISLLVITNRKLNKLLFYHRFIITYNWKLEFYWLVWWWKILRSSKSYGWCEHSKTTRDTTQQLCKAERCRPIAQCQAKWKIKHH